MFLPWMILFFNLALASEEKNKTYPGTYIIIAPNKIRPNFAYSASINVLGNEPVNVEMMIQDEQNKTIVKSFQSNMKPGDLNIISTEKIPTNLMKGGRYHLRAKGFTSKTNKSLFDETKQLYMDTKYFSIFIQTDKATYKPGATVNFRVIAVDHNLKPIQGKANIKITDPQRNVIKQYLDQPLDHGVIGKNGKLSLELSDEPSLGQWMINVEMNDQKSQKYFQVEKYVLPKFDVKAEAPSFIMSDQDYNLTVTAKYTYGKGVVGNALITILSPTYWFREERNASKIIRTVELNKDGQASLLITNEELLENGFITNNKNLSNYDYSSINGLISITETLTGNQRNATTHTTVYRENYMISIEKKPDSFHPGADIEFTVKVTGRDGQPLSAKDYQPVNISLSYYLPSVLLSKENNTYDYPVVKSYQIVKLNSDGLATVKLTTLHNATSLNIRATYAKKKGEDEECYRCPSGYAYISSFKSPTDSYLELVHDEVDSIKVGQTVSVTAKINADLSTIIVQVINKGRIVYNQNVKVKNNKAEIKIKTSYDMTPSARVVVYGVQEENKEIIVDALDMRVDGIFRNNVSIDAAPKRVEPNSTVDLKVKASPKSYVGILAIDKSVQLLRSGNDIKKSQIESEMGSYGSGSHYYWFDEGPRRQKIYWGSVYGYNAASVFDNCGVLVITDALLHGYESHDGRLFGAAGVGGMASGGMAGPPPPPPPAPAPALATTISSKEATADAAPEPQIRSRFLETWIWADAVTSENGEVTYKAEAPDTITSFVATAFAIHETDGFCVADEPANVEVFRPFFIRLDLPYAVKRGEKLALHLIVFNYGDNEQTVTVTLDHDDQSGFEFIDKTGSVKNSKDKDKQSNTRLVKIPANGGSSSIYFPIRPTKIGKLKMLIKAFGQGVSDAVEDYLLVEAEGYALYFNKPLRLDNSSQYTGSNATKLDFPADIVPGSQKVSITVVGDMMANLLNNIGNLIQMPSGCGEQNMLRFVPNIVINKYLKATNRLTPQLNALTIRYIESGYQRELTYQLDDASFSSFGKHDKNGSTWLTAFVVKSFSQAKPYIFIDDANLNKSLNFLLSKKKENGAFEEDGHVHDKGMQGGSGEDNLAASAYVLISLLMNNRTSPETLSFLERSLDRISNNSYALAIVTYAFHLADSSKKDQALKMLEKIAIKKDNSVHWAQTVTNDEDKHNSRWWWWRPRPADIETTSYALLTYLRRNDLKSAMSIFQWLSKQQNAFGGFSSTQDTVVALQALGELAEKTYTGKNDLVVTVESGGKTFTVPITHENSLIQQTYPIQNVNDSISIKTSGHGFAFGQISWHYNILNLENIKPFTCTKEVNQSTANDLILSVCCKYNLKGSSNMAVMEIDAISGFSIETDKLNLLVSHIDQIQRVESVFGDSKANIYFSSLNSAPVCFDAHLQRYYNVVGQKPAVVKLYDYYNPSERTEFEYNAFMNSTLKDVCGPYCFGIID